MYLTRHQTPNGQRLALNGKLLEDAVTLKMLLALPSEVMIQLLESLPTLDEADDTPLPPVDPTHEIWASGVTYLRSRNAREAESNMGDVYERVYSAERPEIFFKSIGWRVAGHQMPVRIRQDSRWNVPEPELTLVINSHQEIVGYCAGNDMSSRDIEGANPLYLPQAKMYNGSCALGPGIMLTTAETMADLPVRLEIDRQGQPVYQGETRSSQMKRTLEGLVDYLTREMDFPNGVFLMTGTGIVPEDDFSLLPGDVVRVSVGDLQLENPVHR